MKLSVGEAARMLEVPEKTLYRWIEQRRLPAHRIGDQYRFNRAELLEWATAECLPVSLELFAEPRGQPAPLLRDALAAGGIHFAVLGETREAVLAQAVSLLRLPEHVDREYLHEMLLARGALAWMGVGSGIAIPQVRSPVVLHAPAAVTLCLLRQPVDFGIPNGEPVRALFLLITPTTRAHLQLLSRLAAALYDPELRGALAERRSAQEISAALQRAEAAFPGAGRGTSRAAQVQS